ncbi:16724_t:CDS:1, partial [Gigaspora rosea]
MTTPSSSFASSEEHQKQLNRKRQKRFRNKNKKTTSHQSNDVSEDLQHLLNTEAPTVVIETSTIDSNSNSVPLEEHQKQLNRERQKRFRDKSKETASHKFINVSNDLQYLFNTEDSTIVVKTSTGDSDSNSVTLEEHQKQLNRERQKRFRDKNKETASPKSIDVFEDLNTEASTVVVETPAIDSNSNSKDNNKETTLQLSITEELQYLLHTEVPIVVVETPAINANSDSDDLSPLLSTEVPIVLIEPPTIDITNIQSNPSSRRDKTKRHDINRMDQTCDI